MNSWLRHHRDAVRHALQRLFDSPLAALLTIVAIGIALALPTTAHMLLSNVQQLSRNVSAAPQITVFMHANAPREAGVAVQRHAQQMAGIKEAKLVTRETTSSRLSQAEGLAEVLQVLPDNPFPDMVVITPSSFDEREILALRQELQHQADVEQVQLDAEWTRRLGALLRLAKQVVWVIGLLLGVALIAVTFNTIRLQTLTRQDEIAVSRLLGATDDYIRRPFLWFGSLQGLFGGLVALGIAWGVAHALSEPVGALAGLYNLDFHLRPLDTLDTLLLLGASAALGWIGARLTPEPALRK